jgi:glutathione S-transferase
LTKTRKRYCCICSSNDINLWFWQNQKCLSLTFSCKEPWFLDINPNGRIPALTDTFEDGKEIQIFESGAIMQYLVDRYDKDHKVSYPHGSREYWEMTCWVSVNTQLA